MKSLTKVCMVESGNDNSADGKPARTMLHKMIKATDKNSCVLLLGTTGAGKTSTLNIYTGNTLATGSQAQSVTDKTTMCPDHIHANGSAWIDNPGG